MKILASILVKQGITSISKKSSMCYLSKFANDMYKIGPWSQLLKLPSSSLHNISPCKSGSCIIDWRHYNCAHQCFGSIYEDSRKTNKKSQMLYSKKHINGKCIKQCGVTSLCFPILSHMGQNKRGVCAIPSLWSCTLGKIHSIHMLRDELLTAFLKPGD